jgi:Type II secretion system (T2SS), protein M subtype b
MIERGSAFLGATIVTIATALIVAVYWLVYAQAADEFARERAAYDQIAWVDTAEPSWRKEYARRAEALKTGSGFFVSSKPHDAAGEFQGKLRQALAGAGASVDALQSSTGAPVEGKLPMIRAVATARIAAVRVIDVVRAVEAIQPAVAVEALDIAIQSIGSPQAPERMAILTITARAYVMIDSDANN